MSPTLRPCSDNAARPAIIGALCKSDGAFPDEDIQEAVSTILAEVGAIDVLDPRRARARWRGLAWQQ